MAGQKMCKANGSIKKDSGLGMVKIWKVETIVCMALLKLLSFSYFDI